MIALSQPLAMEMILHGSQHKSWKTQPPHETQAILNQKRRLQILLAKSKSAIGLIMDPIEAFDWLRISSMINTTANESNATLTSDAQKETYNFIPNR